MLHHCRVEDRNGPKKADGVAGVYVADRRVDRSRWSRSNWSVSPVVAGDIDNDDKNVIEGNRV